MNWIVVNLALAMFWLVLGVGILIVEWQRGQSLFGNPIISPGWLCLIVSGYNVIRVMTMYRYLQRQREADAEEQREREEFLKRPVQVVNPELRFPDEKKED